MPRTIQKEEFSFLYILGSLLVAYAWSSYLWALLGFFSIVTVFGSSLIGTGLLLYCGRFHLIRLSKRQYFSLCIATAIAFFVFCFMHTSTIYTGRDQGAISTAASLLAQNGSPYTVTPAITAFFDIYGPGEALNFPGFHYSTTGALISQFPLPYTSFLAGFALLFGALGFGMGNAILVVSFLLVSGSLVRMHIPASRYEYVGYALLISAFPFLWFARFTLSENLALTLLWLGYAFFTCLTHSSRFVNVPAVSIFFLTITLLFFARIEGVWFLIAFFVLIYLHKPLWAWLQEDLFPRLLLPLTLFVSVALLAFTVSWPFYKTLITVLLKNKESIVPIEATIENTLTAFFYPAFHAYGITMMLILTLVALIVCLWNRDRRAYIYPLILITAPLFFYFLEPHISADHPWMLRRYVFWLVPLSVGATLFLWHHLSVRGRLWSWVSTLILTCIIGIYASVTLPYSLFIEHHQLSRTTSQIAENFTPQDLLLLDGETTGDGWAMLAGPLTTRHDLNAVYFFNPADYAKLDTNPFERIFLISPSSNLSIYTTLLEDIKPLTLNHSHQSDKERLTIKSISTRHLSLEKKIFTSLPSKTTTTTPIRVFQLK